MGLGRAIAECLARLTIKHADWQICGAGRPFAYPQALGQTANLGSASVAILGTAISLSVGSIAKEAVTTTLVPLTAGGFVYLAAADLIPELQHDRSLRAMIVQTILISLGIAVMGLITLAD